MWFGIIALFPEILEALGYGVTGKGLKSGLVTVESWSPRDFTEDKHRTVDDKPYGGGPGMVMMAQPLAAALEAARKAAPQRPTVVYLSPQGKHFDQKAAEAFLAKKAVILIAGRYEG